MQLWKLFLLFCVICIGFVLITKSIKRMMRDDENAIKCLLGYLIAVVIAIGEWPVLYYWIRNISWW